jgi:hypothetical protein
MIVTTTRLTKPAEDLAEKSGIEVVARPALEDQMARARRMIEHQGDGPTEAAPPPPTGPAPEAP